MILPHQTLPLALPPRQPRRRPVPTRRAGPVRSPGSTSALAGVCHLLVLLAAACPFAQLSVDQPIITVEPEVMDFGVLQQNESRSGEITIRNIGGTMLQIRDIKSDCGCTVAEVNQRELEPGESTILSVTFNSKKFEGPQTKLVKIYTNDPQSPVVEYQVLAKVHVPVYVTPIKRQLGFGRLRQGETQTQKAWFKTEDIDQLSIEVTRYNEELFEFEIEQAPEGQANQAVLVVHSLPDAPIGEHREFIRVETNVTDLPIIDFEAFLTVLQDLEAFPAKVDFRYAPRNREMKTKVRVRSTTNDVEFKITGAEIDLPQFQVQVEETIPNTETLIHISGMPITKEDPLAVESQGRIAGTLRIFTNLPQQPEMTIPVRYLLKM